MKVNLQKAFAIIILLLLTSILAISPAQQVFAQQTDADVNIYIFWGEGCPHCEKARPVLQEIAAIDARVGYQEFEVYNVPENRELFLEFSEAYNFQPRYVPTIFVGERFWEGWSDDISAEIQSYIDKCLNLGCTDLGKEVLSGGMLPEPEPTQEPMQDSSIDPVDVREAVITLPLIGTVDLSKQSLLVSTLIISFVDGFNPCSLWVLSMLLAITLNTRSRKKVLIIGLVFIFVTGLIYALFIGGLFTVFSFINIMGWVRLVVALVALVFALVNIKDYFWYKQGISFTISDEKKPGIYKGIRRVLQSGDSIFGLVIGTVILAAGVSLVEFSCTAGLPILWTNLLISQEITGWVFIGFLLVYMLIYQIDELGIFLVSVFTLRKTKLEEKHGRILKLLGGMLMLCLAVVMLIDPQLMNDVINALIIFGIAFGLTAVILIIHRIILPKLNIIPEVD